MQVQIWFIKKMMANKAFVVFFSVLFTGVCVSYAPLMAQYQDADLGSALSENSQSFPVLKQDLLMDISFTDPAALEAFYKARFNEPFWMSKTGLYSRAHDMIKAAQNSWTHGLNPEHYFVAQLNNLAAAAPKIPSKEAHALEMLLTESFIRYARDLSGMRVSAAQLGLRAKDWRQRINADSALTHLKPAENFHAVLQSIAPQSQTYEALREELIRLTSENAPDYESVLPITLRSTIKPGQHSQDIEKIRRRLGVAEPKNAYRLAYDDALAAAVIQFQTEHGVKADGIIGPQTVALMNITARDKRDQIIANLERLRWAHTDRPDKFVIVNIPAAKLWAIEEGKVAFDMPVIVGRPERATPSFQTEITGVRLNPTWTVPPTIKKKDILPKLQTDPMYLIDKGIELSAVIEGQRVTVDPLSIDWTTVKPEEMHMVRLVQIPGDHNPLGKIRVLMPNEFDIYLHDTNQKDYFNKADRAQSSGCMRMQDPQKMAEFILRSKAGWKTDRLESILAAGQLKDISIDMSIPVYVQYYTVWMNEKNAIVFGQDIYGKDKVLLNALAKLDGFDLQAHNKEIDTSNRSLVLPVSLN